MDISSIKESDSDKILHRRVTSEILRDIGSGNFPLGSKLPSQTELIEKYKVSITTIRQSLANLERRGIIRRERGRGTFVSLQSHRHGQTSELTRLGLIFERADRPEDQPAEAEIVTAFVKVCRQHRIRLAVFDVDVDTHAGGTEMIHSFDGMPLDGVCIFLHEGGSLAQERLAPFSREFVAPVALFPAILEPFPYPIDSVHIDLHPGVRHLMKHLLHLGHRRIGYIGSHVQECLAGRHVEGGRWKVYTEELKAAGIDLDPSLLVEIPYGSTPDESVGEKIVALVRRANPATAIFAANDWMARYAMERLWRAGIRVPEEVSVAGLDDVSFSRQLIPSLTTVACPYTRAVETIIEMMQRRLKSPTQPLQSVVIPTELVIRDSVAKPLFR